MKRRPGQFAIVLLMLATAATAARAAAPGAQPVSPPPSPSVHDSPGYVRLADPDSAAERLGRRPNAPLVDMPFTGGAKSLDALGRAMCGAYHASSVDSMLKLCVTQDEFRVILWPEFPQSRPATGVHWDDAWPVLFGRLNGGSVSSVRDMGGHVYQLVSVSRGTTVQYKNFKLHNDVKFVVQDDEGQTRTIDWIRSIAERKGRFKVYSMKD
jgi:hypothetical protein